MNIVQRAVCFVQSLRQPDDARRCRHCGSTRTKKHGFYTRRVCLLRGVRRVRVPRYRCHSCGRTTRYRIGAGRHAPVMVGRCSGRD